MTKTCLPCFCLKLLSKGESSQHMIMMLKLIQWTTFYEWEGSEVHFCLWINYHEKCIDRSRKIVTIK